MRESLDGSESNFSLIDHAFANESALSEGGYGELETGASPDPSRTSYALRAFCQYIHPYSDALRCSCSIFRAVQPCPILYRSHFDDHEQSSCRVGSSNNQHKVGALEAIGFPSALRRSWSLLTKNWQSEQSEPTATDHWSQDRCDPRKSSDTYRAVRSSEGSDKEL